MIQSAGMAPDVTKWDLRVFNFSEWPLNRLCLSSCWHSLAHRANLRDCMPSQAEEPKDSCWFCAFLIITYREMARFNFLLFFLFLTIRFDCFVVSHFLNMKSFFLRDSNKRLHAPLNTLEFNKKWKPKCYDGYSSHLML